MMCMNCSCWEQHMCNEERSPFFGIRMDDCDGCRFGTPSVYVMRKKNGGGIRVKRIRKIRHVEDYEYNYKFKRL